MNAVDSGEWWAPRSGRLTCGESTPDTHWLEGWEGHRTGLGFLGKEVSFASAGIEPRLLGCWIRSLVTIPTALFFLLYYIMMLHIMHVNKSTFVPDIVIVSRFPASAGFSFFPKRSDRLKDPPSFLFNWYQGPFPGLKRLGRDADVNP